MTELTETEALNKVAAYCASAEHCRTEVIEKMQRWGMPYNTIDRIETTGRNAYLQAPSRRVTRRIV